jgi:PIN domain nuclease of toxin-antitoxin system
VILDTCALLWLVEGSTELSEAARKRIDQESAVYVSAITGFEIGIKVQKGKLKLPARVSDWFAAILENHDLELLPLDLETCIDATELPAIHRDPCDRFLIATARRRRMPVVTADPVFRDYGVEVVFCRTAP